MTPCRQVNRIRNRPVVIATRWRVRLSRREGQRRNGSTWAIQITPNPTGTTEAELKGVSCPASATTCMAAGFYATPTINISTLAEVSPAE
jgi:hypothetical protein